MILSERRYYRYYFHQYLISYGALIYVGVMNMNGFFNDYWNIATFTYVFCALLSFLPVLSAILQRVQLHPGGEGFEKSGFSAEEKKLLLAHYSRIIGALGFWKNQALKFKRFHCYVLLWSIPSSVLIPIITQFISGDNQARVFLTVVSSFTAILLSFHKGLKVEDNYKSFRHGESEFFDTYRRLLDRPNEFGTSGSEQIAEYFRQIESIRRYVRNAETDNLASLDEISSKFNRRPRG